MYKIISTLLILAFFAGHSAIASNGNPVVDTQQDIPMTFVTLTQLAAGSAFGEWDSTNGGPYLVTFTNMTTGVRLLHFSTNQEQWAFTNLVVGNTYRLTVGNIDILFDEEVITH